MSINVTVTGNPIKIHRGKLITSDLQDADKRRKMRLQQVRQQSKDIAANVRNNVKKAKSKQQVDFEKANQAKLKEWQNKKLLQVQNSCENVSSNLSAVQKEAEIIEIEEIQAIERQKIVNAARAQQRGRSAHELLQVQKNQQSLKKAVPRQAKQFAREVENVRAAMVIKQKTPKKKKVSSKRLIVEKSSAKANDLNDEDNEGCDEQQQTDDKFYDHQQGEEIPIGDISSKHSMEQITDPVTIEHVKSATTVDSNLSSLLCNAQKKRFRHEDCSQVSLQPIDVPIDTRISDRIRSRHLMTAQMSNTSGLCRPPLSVIPESHSGEPCHIQAHQPPMYENKENSEGKSMRRNTNFATTTQAGVSIPPGPSMQDIITCPMCIQHSTPFSTTCACGQARTVCVPKIQVCPNSRPNEGNLFEVPQKPTVKLMPETYTPQYSQKDSSSSEFRRVRSYDRNNRFGHHYITDTSRVHRIENDELAYSDLEAGPSHRHHSHTSEFTKMADERAKMAEVRGKKAIEKENIHRDYKQLMKKLPLLQKQGKIAKLNPAKDKFHMSDARKKEHEKQRQQNMEHAFETLAPPMITIPLPSGRNKAGAQRKSLIRAKKLPEKESRSVGTWVKPTAADANTGDAQPPDSCNLMSLLEKLRTQKEELLKECKDLPQDSNFYSFIEDLDFVTKAKTKNKDKQIQTEVISKKSSVSNYSRSQKQVLVLQNTSTQTSPNVTCAANVTTDVGEPPTKQLKSATDSKQEEEKKTEVKECSCKDRDKLCEILIKIRDCPTHSREIPNSDEKLPEVVVSAYKVDEALDLETGKSRKTRHRKSDNGSDASISPKRTRSESPKKSSRKVDNKIQTESKTTATQVQHQSRKDLNSWKHQLSTAAGKPFEEMTSTTSYYSPPEYSIQGINDKQRKQSSSELVCQTSQNLHTSSFQQTTNNAIDNKLLSYINKMLEVSKGNLNFLAANVSPISDVPTPTSSVINMQSNRPRRTIGSSTDNHNDSTHIEKLSTLLKYFNLTPGDFRSFVSVNSTSIPRSRSNSNGSDSTIRSNSRNSQLSPLNDVLLIENYTQTPSANGDPAVEQFTQWSQICQARINNLTEMIDKVRMEKREMLNSKDESNKFETSNKSNNLTSYLHLPQNSASSSPHSPSLEQKQLNQQLLDVPDISKLGGARSRPIHDSHEFEKLLALSKSHSDLDRDIVERYMKLVDVELQAQRAKSPPQTTTEKKPASPQKCQERSVSFQPVLDIPKLPKLQSHGISHSGLSSNQTRGRKPPVTTNALRFNDVIHELSAIPEAENSHMSKSPTSRKSTSPQKRAKAQSSPPKSRKQNLTPESSSDSPASEKSNGSLESMLKTIGLDWAINTLKIMNAVQNNSSSSTSDIDMQKFAQNSNFSTSTEKSANDLSRHQRTSTPVQITNSSKSQFSYKLINSGESEISPVASGQGRSKNKSPVFDSSQHSFNTLPSQSVHDVDSDS